MSDLLAALIGAVAALLGVSVAHLFHAKAEKEQRIGNAVLSVVALAWQYQYDINQYGHAFVSIGESPNPLPDSDPETVRQFSLEHSLGFSPNFRDYLHALAFSPRAPARIRRWRPQASWDS